MRKPGDVEMIFGSPIKCEHPIDQAKLIEKTRDFELVEEWWVEYLNEPDKKYVALIKKTNSKHE